MAVRLVFVDLDRHWLHRMVRMAVIVAVAAVWAMHMGRRCGRSGVGVPASVRMPTRAVSAAFGLKRFADFVDDQVHGTQHVGQHMVGFYFQVVWLEFDRDMAVAEVVSRACQVKGATV